ncbi:MAG: hypothetical protein Q9175_006581 [Cornicularia normoerica]
MEISENGARDREREDDVLSDDAVKDEVEDGVKNHSPHLIYLDFKIHLILLVANIPGSPRSVRGGYGVYKAIGRSHFSKAVASGLAGSSCTGERQRAKMWLEKGVVPSMLYPDTDTSVASLIKVKGWLLPRPSSTGPSMRGFQYVVDLAVHVGGFCTQYCGVKRASADEVTGSDLEVWSWVFSSTRQEEKVCAPFPAHERVSYHTGSYDSFATSRLLGVGALMAPEALELVQSVESLRK